MLIVTISSGQVGLVTKVSQMTPVDLYSFVMKRIDMEAQTGAFNSVLFILLCWRICC